MKYYLFVAAMLVSLFAAAQPKKDYTIKDKKAIRKLEEAQSFYQNQDLPSCLKTLEELVQDHPEFVEAQYMLAQVYDETNQLPKAIGPLKAALAANEQYYPPGWLMLAECYFSEGKYDDAEKAITNFMKYPKESANQERRAQVILSSCVYAKNAITHPVPFDPKNLGPEINSKEAEYYPCLTADQKTLLFTRLVHDDRAFRGIQEDFYVANKKDGKWIQAAPVKEINTLQNEGAPTLSADGQTMVFTACELASGSWGGNRVGVKGCDLFFSYTTETGWSNAECMGSGISSGAWDSQPSLSADGRTLYFVRGRMTAHGVEDTDIYYSYLRNDNTWAPPMKVPGKVNTPFQEESVMIHPDGRSLYFSSNGHPGMGGLDIYVSHMTPTGDWDTPINLGYPINTYKDENSIQVASDGQIALMASDREGGYGDLDLYSFELHEKVRSKPVTYVQGVVSDKLSYKKLQAHFELIDLESGKTVVDSYSAAHNGEFLVCLPSGKDYALNVSREGYLFHSENFSLKNYTSMSPFQLDIKLQKVRPGSDIPLKNIFFETNKADLLPTSTVELDKLVSFLKSNPARKVEIGGHTDNVGADADNLKLSEARAASVVKYLVSKGIPAENLSSKGYGETLPVDTNDTEAGRANNRRTVLKIVE